MDWNATMASLLGFIGHPVEVHIGPAGEPVMFGALTGTLLRGYVDPPWAGVARDEEAITFTFEGSALGITLYRDRFAGGTDESTNGMAGVSVEQQGVAVTFWRYR